MLALLVKMLPPLLCGAGAGFVVFSVTRRRTTHFFAQELGRKLPRLGTDRAGCGLLCIVPFGMAQHRLLGLGIGPLGGFAQGAVFLAMYLLYMMSFGYVALMGLLMMVFWRERLAASGDAQSIVSDARAGSRRRKRCGC